MSRALVGFLAISVLSLSACTGLQGGEPHDDDDAASIVTSDDWLHEVPGECGLSVTDAT
jgi:hypothetical protein